MSLTEIFALIIEPFLLYDFAPFLSVAMAINFVSSFWDGVKNRAINNLNDSRDAFIDELNGVYTSGNCNQSDSVKDLNLEADKYKKKLNILSFLATSVGMLVVVGLFFLLALIGLAPKAALTLEQGLWLIFFSIIPSSSLRILGVLYSWHAVKKLRELSQIMKNAAKAAIKDNQQAAYSAT
ncbi:hypothetical protein BST55_22585 [Vibrio vulnificus]|uniref:hypothetical protein n=1 Tax=Vibrio vulnificus TaxID=672 RepID=UPI000BA060E1|nr:hypothetical protein [Vibrio vulnificus]EGR8992373.1 hypothetical protein [Vibrio vulnificus]MCU8566664.1 hypothetical protein [Vibrio vulnificus]OZS51064.1 hypothetical protein BST51_22380 [Vibrio vulnificus]OZS55630.1 hypothetical protein BST52_22665 [Vibrio vulnificus]OZS60352.1 hypothetical protein BST56_22240 [Vibrio vulnificus]